MAAEAQQNRACLNVYFTRNKYAICVMGQAITPTFCAARGMAAAAMNADAMGQAMYDAAEAGDTTEVERLLGAGAPVNWFNSSNVSALG